MRDGSEVERLVRGEGGGSSASGLREDPDDLFSGGDEKERLKDRSGWFKAKKSLGSSQDIS
eukprot:1153489-Karenia_brevis.AAC.1